MTKSQSAPGWVRATDVLRLFASLGVESEDRALKILRRNAAAGHLHTWAAALRFSDRLKNCQRTHEAGLLPAEAWMDESVRIDWLTGDLSGFTYWQTWHADGVQFSEDDLILILNLKLKSTPPADRSPRAQSVSAAIHECEKWLRERFRDDQTSAWKRGDFRDEAEVKFGDRLSGRGFSCAWSAVTKEFPERSKAGAPRKS